ncbi:MAG TPA: hypothetical protein VJZ32_03290 [Candidatus Bathyarchaeia archaeon]|nr:hypothetical protein [Candidatus Bathyarchaeia archaeon]
MGRTRELRILSVLTVLVILCSSVRSTNALLSFHSLQVGAFDEVSGNQGVRVAIRTNAYAVASTDTDSFWVGEDLVSQVLNRTGFIQFGYQIERGSYCLKGFETVDGKFTCTGRSETIGPSDARWFWQYWPNGKELEFYYGVGETNSVGANGTWHMYSIVPGTGEWEFLLDGVQVDSVTFVPVISSGPAYLVAEKYTSSLPFNSLGPVEFRDLGYLYNNFWHAAKMLTSFANCGVNTTCRINPYGIAVDGPGGYLIAGSGVKKPITGSLLWSGTPINYPTPETSSRLQLGVSSTAIFMEAIHARLLHRQSNPT